MKRGMVVKKLSYIFLLLFAAAALSGCEALKTMDSFDEILTGKNASGPEVEMLDQAEAAFFEKKYELSESLFRKVQQDTKNSGYKKQASYGLSCIAIATSGNLNDLRKTVKEMSQKQKFQGTDQVENPRMLIVALDRKTDLLNCDTEIKVVTTEKKIEVNKEHQQEIEQLKQTIEKLKHQISVLEAIDQEIQEKRKPI